jgi:hypothetical protein
MVNGNFSSCLTTQLPISTGRFVSVRARYSFDTPHHGTAQVSLITAIRMASYPSPSKLNVWKGRSLRDGLHIYKRQPVKGRLPSLRGGPTDAVG